MFEVSDTALVAELCLSLYVSSHTYGIASITQQEFLVPVAAC